MRDRRLQRSRRPRDRTPDRPQPWTRVKGTVYGVKCVDAKGRRTLIRGRPRVRVEYVGMYSGDWRERIRQHLYGGGPHRCKPKPFADLVPGFDPDARTLEEQRRVVDRVIEVGGAVILWQGRTWHWRVKLTESWQIFRVLPAYNILENTVNRRHVPKWEQERQRAERDLGGGPRVDAAELSGGDRWTGWSLGMTGSPEWFGPEADELRVELDRRLAGRRGS